jgi:hypothetical protein
MRPVSSAEGITDIEVSEIGEGGRQILITRGLAGMEAHILKQDACTSGHR